MPNETDPDDVELAAYKTFERIAVALERLANTLEAGSVAVDVSGHVSTEEVES